MANVLPVQTVGGVGERALLNTLTAAVPLRSNVYPVILQVADIGFESSPVCHVQK